MSKTTADIFERIVERYGNTSRIVSEKEIRYYAFQNSQIHYELSQNKNIVSIEFHLEKWNDSKTQNERAKFLSKFIECFKSIFIFGKQIVYSQYPEYGRLYLEFDSEKNSEEEIHSYICEFIYQIKSRIENICLLSNART